jgi:L-rhamnose mutarotase
LVIGHSAGDNSEKSGRSRPVILYKNGRRFMQRYGMVIGLRAGKLAEYQKLHAAVWPDVLKMIAACHIRNYSIYLAELEKGRFYLFSYFEYHGKDFAADMAAWPPTPPRRNGGRTASPARTRFRPGPRVNGGRTCRKCFTWIEPEHRFRAQPAAIAAGKNARRAAASKSAKNAKESLLGFPKITFPFVPFAFFAFFAVEITSRHGDDLLGRTAPIEGRYYELQRTRPDGLRPPGT